VFTITIIIIIIIISPGPRAHLQRQTAAQTEPGAPGGEPEVNRPLEEETGNTR